MKFERLIAIVIRLAALNYLFGAAHTLTYLPAYLWRMQNYRPMGVIEARQDVQMVILRAAMDAAMGVGLYVGWRQIASIFTKDCRPETQEQARSSSLP